MNIQLDFDKIKSLQSDLSQSNRDMLSEFRIEFCVQEFDGLESSAPYAFVPSLVDQAWSSIGLKFGRAGFDAFQRLTMLHLISDFENRRYIYKYTDGIIERFQVSFNRILNSVADESFVAYRDRNDVFLKDLALCRQSMFPAGMRIVEPNSGFPRSLLYRAGISQALQTLDLMLRYGGHHGWYQVHTHLSELEEFNPEGWSSCCGRLAEMLLRNSDIKGVWTGSWFNDPVITEISPRLAYLRQMPENNGAYVLFSNVEPDTGALATSQTRRSLYESGEYIPKSYAVIWPRQHLIDWYNNNL